MLSSSFSLVVVAKPGMPGALWLLHWFCTGDQPLSQLCHSRPFRTLLAGHHSTRRQPFIYLFLAFPLCAQRDCWNANILCDFWSQMLSACERGGTDKIVLRNVSRPSISAVSSGIGLCCKNQLRKAGLSFTEWSTSRENKKWGPDFIHRSCHDLFAVTWISIQRLAVTSPISFCSDCLFFCWYLRPALLYLNLKDM